MALAALTWREGGQWSTFRLTQNKMKEQISDGKSEEKTDEKSEKHRITSERAKVMMG